MTQFSILFHHLSSIHSLLVFSKEGPEILSIRDLSKGKAFDKSVRWGDKHHIFHVLFVRPSIQRLVEPSRRNVLIEMGIQNKTFFIRKEGYVQMVIQYPPVTKDTGDARQSLKRPPWRSGLNRKTTRPP